jgi:branched-chain amino acid transport system substrate-binding protein
LRSKRNLDAVLNDENALAVISGMHLPPLIKYSKYINQNKILTLVPWVAGGSINRYLSPDNCAFRLLVDNTKAEAVLVDHPVNAPGCKSPHPLLESGPWR